MNNCDKGRSKDVRKTRAPLDACKESGDEDSVEGVVGKTSDLGTW